MKGGAIHERRPVRLRHIVMTTQAEADALGVPAFDVLGRLFRAANPAGVNGAAGWVSGTYELRLLEEGKFSLRFPNDAGADGVDHVDRFAVIADPRYEAGDEWLEVWDDEPGLDPAGPLFVGTPTEADVNDAAIDLVGFDALELMKTVHESAAGFWRHAPRDVFEDYSRAWVARFVEPFPDVVPAAVPATIPLLGTTGTPYTATVAISPAGGALRFKADADSGGQELLFWTAPIATPTDPLPSLEQLRAGLRIETVMNLDPTGQGAAFDVACSWGLYSSVAAATLTGANRPDRLVLANVLTSPANGDITVRWTSNEDPAGGGGFGLGVSTAIHQKLKGVKPNTPVALAIELRDGWAYCYANGDLGAVMPYFMDPAYYLRIGAEMFLQGTYVSGPGTGWRNPTVVDFDHLLARSREPFLMAGAAAGAGSYRLPGIPKAGGLIGAYYDDRDLRTQQTDTSFSPTRFYDVHHRLKPGRVPVHRRQEIIAMPIGTPPPWIAPGVPADYFSVRWTGSIFLNITPTAGKMLRIKDVNDAVRVWVGKTRRDQPYINDWQETVGAIRTVNPVGTWDTRIHLGVASAEPGWYPIVVEYAQFSGQAGLTLEWADFDPITLTPGAFSTVPATSLSPQGIYEATIRGDSHYEQLQEQGRTFGLQWTLEPRALESGQFPGITVPRVRVGVDTDRIITTDDLVDGRPSRHLDARGVVQGLILDAAGIAADGAQLALEQLDFTELGQHLLIHEDALSLSDITIREVLVARARTLQVLRSTALEEVSFRPRGSRELVDLFPIAGALARLAWTPGLGVRLSFPRLRVDDQAPRQLIAVERAMTPAGLAPPGVSFRPRPRSARSQMRALSRAFASTQRQYQGQLAVVPGTVGQGAGDSRVPWPASDADVVGATLTVQTKSDASAWTITVNGVGGSFPTITGPGVYDARGWVRRDGANPRCYITLAGGTGTVTYVLSLIVRL